MDPQQALRHPAGRLTRFGAIAVTTAALLLGAAAPAAATTSGIDDCDRIARNLKTLEVNSEALALDIVEHMVDSDAPEFDAPAHPPAAVAPVLLLTPRVASILREVFGSEVASDDAEAEGESASQARPDPLPPVAQDETAEQLPASIAPGIRDDIANRYMPRFQRQMYRTDI